MAKIYTNAFVNANDPTLEPEKIPEQLERCAEQMEQAAATYRKLAGFLRKKKITVFESDGFAFCGHFTVDEIDEGRLVQAGLVIDLMENPDLSKTAVFYTDKELDEEMLEDISRVQELMEMPGTTLELMDELEDDDEDRVVHIDFEVPGTVEELDGDEEELAEGTVEYTINDFQHETNDTPFMSLETKKIHDGHFEITFRSKESRSDPTIISFNRQDNIFKYKCGECDTWHDVELDQVYKNLQQAARFIGNMSDGAIHLDDHLSTALGVISDDLRLLTYLVKFDYAIKTDEEE